MAELANEVLRGDLRALARAATLVENQSAEALLRELSPHAGRALTLGVTGAPGAGKSTLCDQLISLLRAEGKTVGVIAVDPSSPVTGGAILGDRIRMQQHHADPGIFIRSMAARGNLGGLARATADMARLMSASGRDYVLIETVGVGQGEIEIARVAQVTVVVLVPGMGDDIQAIKSGIMEIATIFVINKSDRPGAARLEQELRAEGYHSPIVHTIATEAKGIDALLDHIDSQKRQAEGPPYRNTEQQDTGKADLRPARRAERDHGPVGAGAETITHVALRVTNLNSTIAQLRASGVRVRTGENGHPYVMIDASTGGVLLELIQEQQ